jgi:hypothetical protein
VLRLAPRTGLGRQAHPRELIGLGCALAASSVWNIPFPLRASTRAPRRAIVSCPSSCASRRARSSSAVLPPSRGSGRTQARDLLVTLDEQQRPGFLFRDRHGKFRRGFDEAFRSEAVRVTWTPVAAPNDGWFYFSGGSGQGGHYSFMQGRVSNCIFHYGCLGTSYPWIQLWVNGYGYWTADDGE